MLSSGREKIIDGQEEERPGETCPTSYQSILSSKCNRNNVVLELEKK